jgi:hypothetical protein
VDAGAPLADRPGRVRVGRLHPEEIGALVHLEVRLKLPGLPAIGGAQDRAGLSDRPAVPVVGQRDRVEQLLGLGVALVPAVAAVFGPVGGAVIPDRDRVLLVGDRNGEEIVVDVSIPGLGAG